MANKTPNVIREPIVAGRFYEAMASRCAADAQKLVDPPVPDSVDLPDRLHGALAPHAGWVCSGRVAGLALRALADRLTGRRVTLVMTGSVHTGPLSHPALDAADAWASPLGRVPVNHELRQALADLDEFGVNEQAHEHEHSLEVLLPLARQLWGEALGIVPCMIGPVDPAADWGAAIGQVLKDWPEPVAMVCSVDLTHYGPNYGFAPQGVGDRGYQWAHEVNDRQLLDRVERMDGREALHHARTHHSTCGGGAIAATIAACRAMGAEQGYLLEQTDSARELARIGHHDRNNSVGYAAVVFG